MDIHTLDEYNPNQSSDDEYNEDYVLETFAPWLKYFPKDDHSPRINLERGRVWGVAIVTGRHFEIRNRHDLTQMCLSHAQDIAGSIDDLIAGPGAKDVIKGMSEMFTEATNYYAASRN